MAYVNTTRDATFAPASRNEGGLFATLKAVIARRAVYMQTVRELNALSERELADLGLTRDTIPTLAREAAYGK